MSFIFDESDGRRQRAEDDGRGSSAESTAARVLLIADLRHAVYSAVPEQSDNELRAAAWRTRERAERPEQVDEHRASSMASATTAPPRTSKPTVAMVAAATLSVVVGEWLAVGSMYSSILFMAAALLMQTYSTVLRPEVTSSRHGHRRGHRGDPQAARASSGFGPADVPTWADDQVLREARGARGLERTSKAGLAAGVVAVVICSASTWLIVGTDSGAEPVPPPRQVVEWSTPSQGVTPPSDLVSPPGDEAKDSTPDTKGRILEVMTTNDGVTFYVDSLLYSGSRFSSADVHRAVAITAASFASPDDAAKWSRGDSRHLPYRTMTLTGLSSGDRGLWQARISYEYRPFAEVNAAEWPPAFGPPGAERQVGQLCGADVSIDPASGRVLDVSPRFARDARDAAVGEWLNSCT